MGKISDFLFGSGALKKAAAQGDTGPVDNTKTPVPYPKQAAGIDIGKMAQDQADAVLKKKKKPSAAETLQKNLTSDMPQ